MAKQDTIPGIPEIHTYQVNFKYINAKGQVRNGAVAVHAENIDKAKAEGAKTARLTFGETVRTTTVALW